MGARWLTDLGDVLDGAGVPVVEYPGWQTRARSSGGYDGDRPWCVMWHHTASQAAADDDAAYIADGSPDAPLANLYIARDGTVWLIAAGATNTNGKGYALTFTRGRVPDDQMNTHAVGIEIANAGTGEAFPTVQLDSAFAVSLAVCAAYGLDPADVANHHDWAYDRKIDCATADAAPFDVTPVNSSGSWALSDLRNECARRAGGYHPAPHPPPMEDDDMTITAVLDPDGSGRVWIGDGITRQVVPSMGVFSNYVVLGQAGCYRFVNAEGVAVREIGDVFQVGADTLEALGRAT